MAGRIRDQHWGDVAAAAAASPHPAESLLQPSHLRLGHRRLGLQARRGSGRRRSAAGRGGGELAARRLRASPIQRASPAIIELAR